ncbi:hypothetical protein Mapa_011192 [Marchantia paleacea]|nr:hypothetical protein Mapa_011192 [Marchantia paleacea]
MVNKNKPISGRRSADSHEVTPDSERRWWDVGGPHNTWISKSSGMDMVRKFSCSNKIDGEVFNNWLLLKLKYSSCQLLMLHTQRIRETRAIQARIINWDPSSLRAP